MNKRAKNAINKDKFYIFILFFFFSYNFTFYKLLEIKKL